MKVVTVAAAEADLESIGDRIALRSPMNAVRFVRRLGDRSAQLGESPGIGTPRPEWGEGIRVAFFGNYLILHRVRDDTVQVLRVLHGARDIDQLLQDEPLPE